MANFVYTRAKRDALRDYLLNTAPTGDPTDIRAILVMTNTTADTEQDVSTVADFTTLDEFDGSGYSSGGVALTGEVVNQDDANNRAEYDVDDVQYGALSVGTRNIQAVVLIAWGGSLGASVPVAYIDTVSTGPTFPFAANGGEVTLLIDVEGLLQMT